MRKTAWIRASAISVLGAFLLIFFVPFIPVQANIPAYHCDVTGSLTFGCGPMFVIPPGALNYLSLGYYFLHWGASDTYLGGFTPPTISYSDVGGVSTLTTAGVLSFIILPIVATSIALLGLRRLTIFAALSLLGWGLLTTLSTLPQHDVALSLYGYMMAVCSGATVVGVQYGRRIAGYWRMDSESLVE